MLRPAAASVIGLGPELGTHGQTCKKRAHKERERVCVPLAMLPRSCMRDTVLWECIGVVSRFGVCAQILVMGRLLTGEWGRRHDCRRCAHTHTERTFGIPRCSFVRMCMCTALSVSVQRLPPYGSVFRLGHEYGHAAMPMGMKECWFLLRKWKFFASAGLPPQTPPGALPRTPLGAGAAPQARDASEGVHSLESGDLVQLQGIDADVVFVCSCASIPPSTVH